jgi:hypothetical protein
MTQLSLIRSVARQLRNVFRRCYRRSASPDAPLVQFQGVKYGLCIRVAHADVSIEYLQPCASHPSEVICLPLAALADFEGSKEDIVTLEGVGPSAVQARWENAGVPQMREYTIAQEKVPAFPRESKFSPVESGFLKALDDAAQVAAQESIRFALQKLQLRGSTGDVVATDGKQLLVQGGFALPWKDDALVPAVQLFACREVPQDAPVSIGKTDTHVCIRVGPWTFYLGIDTAGRFPKYENIIPAATASATTCRLAEEDAAFLARTLPALPGRDDDDAPLTVDLNGHVAVRAKADGQGEPTEIILSRSEVIGPAVRLVSNRQYLARAIQLGLTEMRVVNPDSPVVCRNRFKTYLWMPLAKDGAVPPSDNATRITSAGAEPATPHPKKERRNDAMPKPTTNGHNNGQSNGHVLPPGGSDDDRATNGTGLGALIAEAVALKDVLHDAYRRSARLVGGLRRQKRQSRLMASTLNSLRQLQQLHHIDG